MPTLIKKVLDLNMKVSMFPVLTYWKDIGTLEDFALAEKDLEGEKKT